MRHRLAVLFAACAAPVLFGAWNGNYLHDSLNSGANWTLNGPGTFNNPGFRVTGGTPGSAISTVAIPTTAPHVDAAALVHLTAGSDSGTYVLYTNASSDARFGRASVRATITRSRRRRT